MHENENCGNKLVRPLERQKNQTVNPESTGIRSVLRPWKASRRFSSGLAFLCALVFFLAATSGHAQEFRGTISGAVTDTSGAVVPGATIVAREEQTGAVSHTVSDAAGQYAIPFLLPGTYDITATANGFEEFHRTGVTLESQGHLVVDLQLKVGSATVSVTVTGAPPQLNVANGSVGTVITTDSVANMPLNGRTPTTLAELAPGVITTAAPQMIHPFDNNAGNSWSMGGTPNQVSEVLLDGAPDLTLLGALAYAPSQDTVAEVSVRPFDTDASFGHTIGGVINQTTKSGTNQLHGTLYEFGQISGIDANTWFNDYKGTPLPVFHFNQYGLTVGGPVMIPKLYDGRNKLFFFFAWEGLKDSTPATTVMTVPTSAEKGGDFTQTLASGCSTGNYTIGADGVAVCSGGSDNGKDDPNQLFNPFTATQSGKNVNRQPIVGNQLSTIGQALNPIALNYLKLFPDPNTTVGVGPDGEDNYVSNAPSTDTYDNEFGRLDYNISDRDHFFFDISHNDRYQLKNDYFGNGSTGTTLTRENYRSMADNVFTLNATTFFDTRFSWIKFNEVHGTPGQKYSPSGMGFPDSMNSSSYLLQLPYINFSTGGSCGSFTSYTCFGDTGSAIDPTTSYQAFVDMVKILGKHTLKVGFDGRRYLMSITNYGDSSGSFTFNSSWDDSGTTGAAQTFGGDLAAFEMGLPSSGEYDLNARGDYHQYYIGTFIQDDWRVNNRLTLNLGLRFDIDTPFREKLGRTVNGFDPTALVNYAKAVSFNPITTTAVDGVTYTVNSINTNGGLTYPAASDGAVYKNNSGFLSPRFGFSFQMDSKTVARGGFGIFVQPENLATLAATGTYSSSALSNQEGFSAATSYVATNNNYLTPATTLNNPFPSGFTAPYGSSLGASTFLGQAISFLAPYEHDPYSERWNLGVQRALSNNLMVEVMYVGNHGLHLPVASQNLNAVEKQYMNTNPWRSNVMNSAYGQTFTNPFKGALGATNTTSLNSASTEQFNYFIRPFPQFGTSAVTEENQTIGQSWFNSGIVHVEKRMSNGLMLTGNYMFSKLIEQDTFLNDEDTMPTRRISPFDHVHHFTVGGIYELPFGAKKRFNFGGSRLMNEIFGGYSLNAIYQFQTGAPIEFSADIPLQPGVNIRQINNQTRNTSPNPGSNGGPRPALSVQDFVTGNTTKCSGSASDCDGSTFFNGQYTSYHYRTLPQTMSWVRQDGYNNLDASILKNFQFTEHSYFQLRFETFNTLNHAVFSAPSVSSATSSSFGAITSTISNSLPRQIQIGGRIVF